MTKKELIDELTCGVSLLNPWAEKLLDEWEKKIREDTINECIEVVEKIINACIENGGCRSKCDEPYACVFGIDIGANIERLKEKNDEN